MASGRVSELVSGETAGGSGVPDSKAYGNQVRILTGTGTTGFKLTYAHWADIYVCPGQEAVQGQLLDTSRVRGGYMAGIDWLTLCCHDGAHACSA